MTIRNAHRDDLPRIVRILNQSAGTGANARLAPVGVDSREAWFDAHAPDRFPIWIAETERDVVGWCSLSPWRSGRGALAGVAEISYYVDAAHHRQGIATRLVRHARGACPGLEIHTLLAIGLESNPASEALLIREGFERWGLLPGVADLRASGGRRVGQWIYGRTV